MFEEIKLLRKKSAKFYKADFHIHSPFSQDWKNDDRDGYIRKPELDRISKDGITADSINAFCERCVSSGLHIVAVTDHMKYGFSLKCAEYAKQKLSDLLILPGLELNIKVKQPLLENFRIHILAIFPPNIGTGIDRIFPPKFSDESRRKGDEEIECSDISEIINKIKQEDGIAIAAHIYNENGVRYIYTKATELLLEPIDDAINEKKDEFYKKICDSLKKENCL